MVKLAVEGNVRVLASDIEFSLERPSYTANTLRVLTEKFPQHAYTIILGEDIRASFHLWREYEWILSSFKIGFFPRNHPVPDPGLIEWNQFDAKLYDAPRMEISSTLIRHNFQHGISNRYLLSEEVLKYIEKQGLYG